MTPLDETKKVREELTPVARNRFVQGSAAAREAGRKGGLKKTGPVLGRKKSES